MPLLQCLQPFCTFIGKQSNQFHVVGVQLSNRFFVQSCHIVLQRQEDSEHTASELLIVKITDESNNMLVRTNTVSALPGIVSDIISEWLTVKLVSGNQKIIDFMLTELDEEDYSDMSCQIFITPILKSANLQLLRSTVNLFLHQEDYFETFDSQVFELQLGIASESMMFLIDSMKENEKLKEIMAPLLYNMLFPKKELETEEDSHDEILNLAADCLRNPKLRQQLLTDSHPHKVYVALWAIGFYNTDDVWVVANQLIKEERSLSKEVVLSYYQNHWAKESLEVITQRINPT